MTDAFPTPTALLEPANDLLGDRRALATRWEQDGCLLLRGLLDDEGVAAARADLEGRLRAQGAVREGSRWSGLAASGIDAFALHAGEPLFVELANSTQLAHLLSEVHGEAMRVYRSVQIRYALPGDDLHTIPAHQDARYITPDPGFFAFWIPLADIPLGHGGLALVAGSHHAGLLEHPVSERHYSSYMGEERPQRCIPLERVRSAWSTAEFKAGDVLVFDSLLIHSALPNRSPNVRLSIDGRYQPANNPVRNWQARWSVLEGTARRQHVLQLIDDVDNLPADVRESVVALMLAEERLLDRATVRAALAECGWHDHRSDAS
jgi:ectoine hydroxylase-related dioxygenase (phytanoyl-CoA dioxygenase family)